MFILISDFYLQNNSKYFFARGEWLDRIKKYYPNYAKHDPKSPLLVGSLEIDDKVNDRKVKSLKQNQFSLF